VRALLWSGAAGVCFCVLNAIARWLTLTMDPFQALFLRYFAGLVILLPLVAHSGVAAWWPQQVGGQFARGALHSAGLALWFVALPKLPLADVTAIGFTTPLFIMLGAYLVLKEPMHWERWLAAGIGFAGVLIVVGPQMSGRGGAYGLVMLASAPLFAASFLVTKALTRYERSGVILLWQCLTICAFTLPMAWWVWRAPTGTELLGFAACGAIGNVAHYMLMRSFRLADISVSQTVKFLDLVWATLLGWLIFADVPTQTTLIGGSVIFASTLWIAHREARRGR
jgi:drug/metabolite transporter (DMT)-like permease